MKDLQVLGIDHSLLRYIFGTISGEDRWIAEFRYLGSEIHQSWPEMEEIVVVDR